MKRKTRRLYLLLIAALAGAGFMLQGCAGEKKPDFKTEYQAVLLGDGQVFYGKVDRIERDFLVLSEAYYFQKNPAAQEGQALLVKRGREPHGPDASYINSKYIVMVEPVKPDSQIANAIREIQKKMAGAPAPAPAPAPAK